MVQLLLTECIIKKYVSNQGVIFQDMFFNFWSASEKPILG